MRLIVSISITFLAFIANIASFIERGIFKQRANPLPLPVGTIPNIAPVENNPFTQSFIEPSPPTATTISKSRITEAIAIAVA